MGDTQVFYNGGCPVCSTAVERYRRLVPGAEAVCWNDVQLTPEALAGHGISVDDVARRIHVLTRDGRMLVGMEAVAMVWDETPSPLYQGLAKLSRHRLLRKPSHLAYEGVAKVLYAWNSRRSAKT